MSFKDLTTRAAAITKPNPVETAKNPAKETESKAESQNATPGSEAS